MDRPRRYIAPTVVRDVPADHPLLQDEIFGPILPVQAVPSLSAVATEVGTGPTPLALYVFTRDQTLAERIMALVPSGGVCVNDVVLHLSIPELPFGGLGASGFGAYHGSWGFELFSHMRAVLKRTTALDVGLRYPPYGERALTWYKRLV